MSELAGRFAKERCDVVDGAYQVDEMAQAALAALAPEDLT